jgi:hypothetical protein
MSTRGTLHAVSQGKTKTSHLNRDVGCDEASMCPENRFIRMMDKEHKPTEDEIEAFIGQPGLEAWRSVKRFVADNLVSHFFNSL